jgi:hypothetical protein
MRLRSASYKLLLLQPPDKNGPGGVSRVPRNGETRLTWLDEYRPVCIRAPFVLCLSSRPSHLSSAYVRSGFVKSAFLADVRVRSSFLGGSHSFWRWFDVRKDPVSARGSARRQATVSGSV